MSTRFTMRNSRHLSLEENASSRLVPKWSLGARGQNHPSATLSNCSALSAVKNAFSVYHRTRRGDLTRPGLRPILLDVTMRISSNGMVATEMESPLDRRRRQKVDLAIFAQPTGFTLLHLPGFKVNQTRSSQKMRSQPARWPAPGSEAFSRTTPAKTPPIQAFPTKSELFPLIPAYSRLFPPKNGHAPAKWPRRKGVPDTHSYFTLT